MADEVAVPTEPPQSTELKRTEDGRFAKGTRGGPGGSRKPSDDVLELLYTATPKACQRVIQALDAMKTIAIGMNPFEVEDWDTRLKAVNILWDRRYGKPVQTIANDQEQPFELKVGDDLVQAISKLAGESK